ncbi:hypothetical protein B0H10DRAFT_1959057 [Mycena sp. CBHHK59/15]|nr:hypothetical protein B0H10DRAFT_1959057 [Mycena sp. CBHHK59/15]
MSSHQYYTAEMFDDIKGYTGLKFATRAPTALPAATHIDPMLNLRHLLLQGFWQESYPKKTLIYFSLSKTHFWRFLKICPKSGIRFLGPTLPYDIVSRHLPMCVQPPPTTYDQFFSTFNMSTSSTSHAAAPQQQPNVAMLYHSNPSSTPPALPSALLMPLGTITNHIQVAPHCDLSAKDLVLPSTKSLRPSPESIPPTSPRKEHPRLIHAVFTAKEMYGLVNATINVNPYSESHGKKGKAWEEVARHVKAEGLFIHAMPETMKGKMNGLIKYQAVHAAMCTYDEKEKANRASMSTMGSCKSRKRHLSSTSTDFKSDHENAEPDFESDKHPKKKSWALHCLGSGATSSMDGLKGCTQRLQRLRSAEQLLKARLSVLWRQVQKPVQRRRTTFSTFSTLN